MKNLPKICLGAWAWGNDGTFGKHLTEEMLKLNLNIIREWEKKIK